MKNIVVPLALLLAFAGGLSAQVSVEVLMGQEQFLPNEAIPVRVRVVNNSGQTITFGKDDWLSFSVEARDGLVVLKSGEPPQVHDFDIKSSEMATTPRTDLAPYFTIVRPGRYTVTATVRIKDWDRAIVSPPKTFDIVSGVRLWAQEFGLPQAATNHTPPEVRKYILQQATMIRRTKLYFELTDAMETRVFRVFPLGPVISFSEPKMRLDQYSNLHLLFQEGSHVYDYAVFNPDGDLIIRQTYFANSNPHLAVDDAGTVSVAGAVRQPGENDVPSTKRVSTNDIPPPVRVP